MNLLRCFILHEAYIKFFFQMETPQNELCTWPRIAFLLEYALYQNILRIALTLIDAFIAYDFYM